jgi:hypothetical protein
LYAERIRAFSFQLLRGPGLGPPGLDIHGVMPEAASPPVGSNHMLYRVMSKDPTRREGGKQDILAAIAGR